MTRPRGRGFAVSIQKYQSHGEEGGSNRGEKSPTFDEKSPTFLRRYLGLSGYEKTHSESCSFISQPNWQFTQ